MVDTLGYLKRPDLVAKHYSCIRTYPCIHPVLVLILFLYGTYPILLFILFLYLCPSYPCIHPILVLILFLYCTYPILLFILFLYLCLSYPCIHPILVFAPIPSFYSSYSCINHILVLYLSYPCTHHILVLILFLYCTYPILLFILFLYLYLSYPCISHILVFAPILSLYPSDPFIQLILYLSCPSIHHVLNLVSYPCNHPKIVSMFSPVYFLYPGPFYISKAWSNIYFLFLSI